ncbi:MAG: hypothetical protein J6M18_01105 [Actinomycetaceae bacterium]|nr:hypothetical protein [Actinomycetaceae bacterium]
MGAAKKVRYAILTPFAQEKVIAAICKLHHADVRVVRTSSGVLIMHECVAPVYDEWDIRNITGSFEMDEEDNAQIIDITRYISRLSPYGAILFSSHLSDSSGFDEGLSGQIRAYRYLKGEQKEEVHAGLFLQELDRTVEYYLLNSDDFDDSACFSSRDVTDEDLKSIISSRPKNTNDDGEEG